MRILITGGAGFIGSATALQLLDRGHDVVVLDNFLDQIHGADPDKSYTWSLIKDRVAAVQADIRDREAVNVAVADTDAILHLAAETGTGQSMYTIERYVDVNVMGTAVLLEAIARRERPLRSIVVASSRSIYGEGSYTCTKHGVVYPAARTMAKMAEGAFEPDCPHCGRTVAAVATTEDARLTPASIYASTKLAQENMVLNIAAARGISAFGLRYQNVYGAGQSLHNPYTGILSIFSREMLAGRSIEIFEDGLESRDFVHVRDVAAVNALALEQETPAQHVLNVGTGQAVSVNEVAANLARQYGFAGDISISGRFRAGDIRHNYANQDALEAVLKFRPRIAFEDGISEFCGWVKASALEKEAESSYQASLKEMEKHGLMGGGGSSVNA